jgi:peptidoglycan/xylan/chitin deacetylase (PgdA/CDA1 family)
LLLLVGCAPPKPPSQPPIAQAPAEKATPEARWELAQGLATLTPVLTYHDIIERRGPGSVWFDCTVEEFEEQLRWLKDQCAVFLTLGELLAGLRGESELPKNGIAITFADNYLGFYRHAVPILRRERIPATLFVHTGFVGSSQGRPKLNWDQLREVDADPLFDVQSQTVSHAPDLRELSDQALEKEFTDSRLALERELGGTRRLLAYPSGKWDERVAEAARRSGYLAAFSEVQEPAERSASLLSVNRYVHTRLRLAWREGREDTKKEARPTGSRPRNRNLKGYFP